jgi:hypothetical protein
MVADGDPDPTSAGTAGEAARRGGASAVVGMAANPFGAHRVGVHRPTAWPDDTRPAMMLLGGAGSGGDQESPHRHALPVAT